VNNVAQAEKLENDGVKPLIDLVKNWHQAMSKKVYRLRNIVRVIKVLNKSKFSESMIKDHQIQAAIGIAKIKKDDSSFWEEMNIIKVIIEETYGPLQKTAKEMEALVDNIWRKDPQQKHINKAIAASELLNHNKLDYYWRALDKKGQDDCASKLARFIRTL
jgi:hypothetical protein